MDAVTLAVSAKANSLKKMGHDVCNLSAGAPQVDTPDHIKMGAKKALDQGKTKYSIVQGEDELRESIAKKLLRENSLKYTKENIVITNGAKQALYNLMQALITKGDEVLIPSPYWLSFPDIVKLAEGIPIFVQGNKNNHYKVTANDLEKAITKKTKIIIFNSPANPTGGVYTREEIQDIADLVIKYQLLIISDEIFEKIIFDNTTHISIASLNEEIFNKTIVVNGFSKIYSMTGWRVGYLAAPIEIAQAVTRIQSHLCSNVCLFAQVGSILCYESPESVTAVENLVKLYDQRRRLACGLLNEVPGVTCPLPQATFYAFPDISVYGLDSMSFCMRLLHEYHVACVPGSVFGSDKNIRLLYATDEESLVKGVTRLKEFVLNL